MIRLGRSWRGDFSRTPALWGKGEEITVTSGASLVNRKIKISIFQSALFSTPLMGNVAQRLSPSKPQVGGVSPSSTADSTYRAPVVDAPPTSHPTPAAPAEQPPESSDTSHGVEATAVRKLAATTGTVAILGTTAQTPEHAAPSHEAQIVGATLKDQNKLPVAEEFIEITPAKSEEQVVPQEDEKGTKEIDRVDEEIVRDTGSASSDSARQVPQITETLVASLENSPVEEVASRRSSPDGAEPNSTDVSGIETQVTRSTDVASDDQLEGSSGLPKASKAPSDEAKSENNDSTRTLDNDISSEQMKTNSLSDVSFSEMDDKEAGSAAVEQKTQPEVFKTEAPSTESDRSEAELKLVEITPDSVSDSSPQITKEESTSDITSDQQDAQQGDEERLLNSTTSDERASDIEDDDESKKNNAAIKIQSSFRGFKVRKARSPKQNEDQLEEQLTLSEIEIVKQQVEGIIKEAEETTESLRNTPDITNIVNTEEAFPEPPDETVLLQLHDDDNEKDTQSLNSELVPYPNGEAASSAQLLNLANTTSDSDEKQSPTDNEESTTAVLARMTADEDLPAPDFELLESSCTDDLTEVPSDRADDEPPDSTEGDVTLEEDSDKMKDVQKVEVEELKAKTSSEDEVEELKAKTSSEDEVEELKAKTSSEVEVEELKGKPSSEVKVEELKAKTSSEDEVEELKAKTSSEDEVKELKAKTSSEDEVGELKAKTSSEVEVEELKGKTSSEDEVKQLKGKPSSEVEAEIAATKIQANVRGYLTRKQVEMTRQEAPDEQQSAPSEDSKSAPASKEEVAEEVAVAQDLGALTDETPATDSSQNAADSREEETPLKSSPTLQISAEKVVSAENKTDEEEKQLPPTSQSETSDLVESLEEPAAEITYVIDEGLDKMSSQSDSISQDTISQNTVEEMLKQQDHIMPLKPYLGENTPNAVFQPQDTIDDRTENDIISDNTLNPDILIKTLPDVDINDKFAQDDLPEIIPAPIKELLNELPKAITPDIDGNENSSQSIEELSSNPDRENLFPSNDNSTIDVPEISSAEETKGSSTASITSDSTKEKTSLGEVSELTKESDSKANTDVDVEEISESDIRTSDESSDQPKLVAEPESPKTNGAPASGATAAAATAEIIDIKAPSTDANPAPVSADTAKRSGEQAEIKEESETAILKNGSEPKPPSELDNLEDLLNNSATKIQANVRGYLSRKKQPPNEPEN
ncbi:hypothetical protein GE061_001065 [Apolygus lucorum]|uniref:Uncharacterized protein n=1 Tax=Apolygus lucorum TaxID=248454 RepID=A0A8S9Y8E7_APOLU|nr:hypothetical protein GE061_001065 [Apolygus lucorum]